MRMPSQKLILTYANDHLRKMKLNKSPGFDNISAEHLVYDGPILHVHLCLLFNTAMYHKILNLV